MLDTIRESIGLLGRINAHAYDDHKLSREIADSLLGIGQDSDKFEGVDKWKGPESYKSHEEYTKGLEGSNERHPEYTFIT